MLTNYNRRVHISNPFPAIKEERKQGKKTEKECHNPFFPSTQDRKQEEKQEPGFDDHDATLFSFLSPVKTSEGQPATPIGRG